MSRLLTDEEIQKILTRSSDDASGNIGGNEISQIDGIVLIVVIIGSVYFLVIGKPPLAFFNILNLLKFEFQHWILGLEKYWY